MRKNSISNFWSRVKQVGNVCECWHWTGHTCHGYGYVRMYGKRFRAHRLAYIETFGQPPSDLVLDHVCGVRSCCNPWHLEAVTQQQNVLRGNSPDTHRARWAKWKADRIGA